MHSVEERTYTVLKEQLESCCLEETRNLGILNQERALKITVNEYGIPSLACTAPSLTLTTKSDLADN